MEFKASRVRSKKLPWTRYVAGFCRDLTHLHAEGISAIGAVFDQFYVRWLLLHSSFCMGVFSIGVLRQEGTAIGGGAHCTHAAIQLCADAPCRLQILQIYSLKFLAVRAIRIVYAEIAQHDSILETNTDAPPTSRALTTEIQLVYGLNPYLFDRIALSASR